MLKVRRTFTAWTNHDAAVIIPRDIQRPSPTFILLVVMCVGGGVLDAPSCINHHLYPHHPIPLTPFPGEGGHNVEGAAHLHGVDES